MDKKKLKKTTLGILRHLQMDGKALCKHLADACGISISAASNYCRELETNHVILGTRALIDPSAVGILTIGYISLRIDSQLDVTMELLRAVLDKTPSVIFCQKLTGQPNILIKIGTHSNESLYKISDTFGCITNITVVNTAVVLEDIIADRGFNF